ncbi:hypothetical protein ACHWQZ_G007876 [Mnemiopsis leidyi]
MEMTTSYRYEREVPRAAALHRALARQNARIRETEMLAADKAAIKETFIKSQIALWNETSEETVERKILKRYQETMDQELQAGRTQLLAARRENLRKLLESEMNSYRLELEKLGLTFFQCRI